VRLQNEIEQARKLLEAGSKDQAIALLREILREDPDNADAHLLLGSALALVPERSEALKELQRVVELQPSSAVARFTLATAQARFGDPEAAKKSFEKTLQLDPRFAEAHVSLAMILAQQKELASARDHLIRAIQIQGNTRAAAHSHYLLAQVFAEQDELEKALEELNTATSLRPKYAEAFLAQGFIRRQQRNDVAAIAAFKRAVALAPDDFDAQHELGAAYLRGGDASQAVVHLRYAAKLKPGDRSTLYQLCRALQKAGKAEEAKACEHELSAKIRMGLATAGNELTATQANNAGVELEKAGNLAGALEKYRVAVSLDSTQTVFRRNAALALCRLGRWDEGIVELQEVLKENPDDAEATKALYIALENVRAGKTSGTATGKAQVEPK
jgi:tetratricopeptide (TPR) repeat protein